MDTEAWLVDKLNETDVYCQEIKEMYLDPWHYGVSQIEEFEDFLEMRERSLRLSVGDKIWGKYIRYGRAALEARVDAREEAAARAELEMEMEMKMEMETEMEMETRSLQLGGPESGDSDSDRAEAARAEAERVRANRTDLVHPESVWTIGAVTENSVPVPAEAMSTTEAVRIFDAYFEQLRQESPDRVIPPREEPSERQIERAGGQVGYAEAYLSASWDAAQADVLRQLTGGDRRIIESLPLDCLLQLGYLLDSVELS